MSTSSSILSPITHALFFANIFIIVLLYMKCDFRVLFCASTNISSASRINGKIIFRKFVMELTLLSKNVFGFR